MADQYPQYPHYPPNPQGGPPSPYSNPYPYAQGQQRPATATQVVKNPWATRALIYGILSIVLVGVLIFTNYIFVGLAGLYAIYYGIRGISYSTKLPGNKGLAMSIIGLVLSIIGVLGTIGVLILSALPSN